MFQGRCQDNPRQPSEMARHGLTSCSSVPKNKTIMKMMKRNAAAAAVAALSLAAAPMSQAVPSMQISDGVNAALVITDNSALDSSLALGQVNYNGTYNGWTILVSSGVSKPFIGSINSPALDLSFQITRSGASQETLSVFFSDNDFNVAAPANFMLAAGGTLGNLGSPGINVRSYYNLANVPLAATTQLTGHAYNSQGGFSGNDVGGPVPADPSVAFTIRMDLSEAIGGVASGDIDLHISVPEGGSMLTLLGTGFVALGLLAARRKSARA